MDSSSGAQEVYYKVIIVGDQGCGKTSFVQKLSGKNLSKEMRNNH